MDYTPEKPKCCHFKVAYLDKEGKDCEVSKMFFWTGDLEELKGFVKNELLKEVSKMFFWTGDLEELKGFVKNELLKEAKSGSLLKYIRMRCHTVEGPPGSEPCPPEAKMRTNESESMP